MASHRAAGGLLAIAVAVVPSIWISSPARAAEDPISLNFKDAEIDSVVGAYGHLLNRTFIVDPRVRGKITLETPRPVSREQAYELLQAALRMQGFAIVDNGGLAKVVPEADAKLQSGPVTVPGTARASQGDQVVTQIFRLQHESASNLVPVLRPLITPNNTITAYPNNNSLVITDYAANVQRLARIISSLDGPTSTEVEILPIRNALASDIAVTLTKLIDDSARAGAGAGAATSTDPGQRVVVLADPRMNAVMIRAASPARMSLAKSLVGRLDQPSTSPGNIHVVYLRNAEALRLAQVLRGVLASDGGAGGMQGGYQNTQTGMTQQTPGTALGQQTQTAGTLGSQQQSSASTTPLQSSSQQSNQPTAIVAGGAVIAADPATNSLIITAPDPLYRNLREVIDRLDARRAQIYIESLIVEISATRAAELGVQWQFLDQTKRVIGGTNFNGSTGGGNIITSA
ncbi:MAG: type II secretion system secretin GspD, partial [Burkholderiaceae bacterium]